MDTNINLVAAYIASLDDNRKIVMQKLQKLAQQHLPNGFEECISYGMIGYVVPHSLYPNGYHCNPKLPLPFIAFGSLKNSVNIHHMGIYANENLKNWFELEFSKQSKAKLDIGKGCIRFKNLETIPYDLIGELLTKITPKMWIAEYETVFKKKK